MKQQQQQIKLKYTWQNEEVFYVVEVKQIVADVKVSTSFFLFQFTSNSSRMGNKPYTQHIKIPTTVIMQKQNAFILIGIV